jgi:hypothetical protein
MRTIATSFADPADVLHFRNCKERGGTDQECFKIGDNGVGYWGDDCTEGSGLACALPPDDVIAQFGSMVPARRALVRVTANNLVAVCLLKDRMPWKKNIKNGAGIDLNPDACAALGLCPPVRIEAEWEWAD